MKAIFFEGCMTLMSKNLLPIAKIFSSREPDFTAVFVSADSGVNTVNEIELLSEKEILQKEEYSIIHLKTFSATKIESFLIIEKPDFVFIDAFRIFDQLWTAICKKLGIRVFSQQHGFEIDSINYKPIALLYKFKREIRYTYAVYNLSKVARCSFFKMFYQYSQYILNGGHLKDTLLGNPDFQPTIAFIYSDYYKEFWNKKYGLDFNRMEIITPSDFLLIKGVKEKKRQNACCYITQTLVEDGRMNEKEFLKLMKSYRYLAQSVNKFIIKLHPRVNADFYTEMFNGLENVEITRDFPNCSIYLTHYSSMAYVAYFLTNNVILHELPGHPTHEIFTRVASTIVHSTQEIVDYIQNNQDNPVPLLEERKQELNYYCIYDETKYPYEVIYNSVKKNLNKS